ncbi:hypothetical protein KDL01_01120 [Actinospica durhamensis]|uniref:HEAT repeat domain-containing protein n=1 Tax=Actinospica durhamensis TaxID=1508375 RepID=A0A941ILL0_9ACTN|nr:hypothetical protein [Actinospica durhamensis]MBR7831839.1 hypothetical protein [Actinospica durhamensis]
MQRAETEPTAAEAVYECLFEDLRWDHACDERDSYLAGLIHRLGLPLAPMERRILDEISASREARPRAGSAYRARRQEATEASLDDLVRGVATGGQERAHALAELGRRGEHRVLDLAEEICRDNPPAGVPGMSQALDHLGSAAVPRARVWSVGGSPTLARLGIRVLAEHGDTGDVGTLHAALNGYVAGGDWCAAETPARGLGRIGAPDAVGDLMAAWEATPHSLARPNFLQALVGCRAPWAEACAEEGLFDCQEEVQILACATAPDSVGVRQRLREIARDPLVPQAHEAADARLQLLSEPCPTD